MKDVHVLQLYDWDQASYNSVRVDCIDESGDFDDKILKERAGYSKVTLVKQFETASTCEYFYNKQL